MGLAMQGAILKEHQAGAAAQGRHVEIAVPVGVADQGPAEIAGGGVDIVRAPAGAEVFPPVHGPELGGAHEIDVPVPVQIGGVEVRDGGAGILVMLGPSRAVPGGVFPPAEAVVRGAAAVDKGRCQHIGVAVPVHVRQGDGLGGIDAELDVAPRPRRAVGIVLPPVDRVAPTHQVHVAVAVHIVGGQLGRRRRAVDRVGAPGAAVTGRIFEPHETADESADIDVAVTIEVAAHGAGAGTDHVFRPRAAVPRRVLPPSGLGRRRRRGQHVEIAVAVHIHGLHRARRGDGADGVRAPERTVFEPHEIGAHLAQKVGIAVTVHVGPGDKPRRGAESLSVRERNLDARHRTARRGPAGDDEKGEK